MVRDSLALLQGTHVREVTALPTPLAALVTAHPGIGTGQAQHGLGQLEMTLLRLRRRQWRAVRAWGVRKHIQRDGLELGHGFVDGKWACGV